MCLIPGCWLYYYIIVVAVVVLSQTAGTHAAFRSEAERDAALAHSRIEIVPAILLFPWKSSSPRRLQG
ncbi:hypothetical protein BJY04DRAFT_185772 [Aspergillus karnatakaensis]|uniref:uncharacterized protein n=1 Tax=Aspergillus karnatakaensis TaxID=1810916 RepID=UPI003CCCD5A9